MSIPRIQSPLRALAFGLLFSMLTGCVLQQQARPEAEIPAEPQIATSNAPTPLQVAVSEPAPEPEVEVESAESTAPLPPADLWERIRGGMQLTDRDHAVVEQERSWFARHQNYLDRVADRAEPYLHLIVEAVEERGLPTELALLPVVESAFQPFAYSHGRAAGLWQFIPGTGRRYGLRQSWWYDGRRDVVESTRAALDYLEYLHGLFDGDWLLALAAYNSGEGTVQRAIRNNRKRGRPTDFWHLALPRETRGYVPRLLAVSDVVANPGSFGLTLKPIANEPRMTLVATGSQIDLSLAAELAELKVDDLYRYNPGFNRWATDPDGPHQLLIPLEKAPLLQARLAEHPPEKRVSWNRHTIRSGESLGLIAERYRTSVALVKKVNGIRGNLIRAGDTLLIPVARTELADYTLSADQRRVATQEKSRKGKRLEYTVKRGDTLWDIARLHGVGVRELASWNSMAPRDTLRPGRKLVIWSGKPTTAAAGGLTPVSFSHPHEKSLRQRIAYTVRQGDSLARISQRFRVSVDDLKQWNKLGKHIHPGQRLTLYVDVTSQSGNI